MGKWVVCVNQFYYPEVTEYDSYEQAKEAYDKEIEGSKGSNSEVYLCEVKESQEFRR